MVSERTQILIGAAILLAVAVAIAAVIVASLQPTETPTMTPTMSITYLDKAPGNYTFTVESIDRGGVARANSAILVIPSAAGIAQSWLDDGQYIESGDRIRAAVGRLLDSNGEVRSVRRSDLPGFVHRPIVLSFTPGSPTNGEARGFSGGKTSCDEPPGPIA